MNINPRLRTTFFIIGSLLFSYIFWNESVGVNLLLFNAFVVGGCLFTYPIKGNRNAQILALGTTMLSVFVAYHNSTISMFTYWLTLIAFVGFAQSKNLRIIPSALLESLLNYFSWFTQAYTIKNDTNLKRAIKGAYRFIKLVLLPVIIASVFYALFKSSNPIFEEYSDSFWSKLSPIFDWKTVDISFGRILFFLWGSFTMGWIFYIKKESLIINLESKFSIDLTRKNYLKWMPQFALKYFNNNSLALVNENNSASVLLVLVNLLLLIINIIDINWIWFSFDYENITHLSQFVHEGTYFLIFSILLSLGILLYVFRCNQNFFPRSNRLKYLAYGWIAQNIILVISVAIRNYHYIHVYGLSLNRIGVVFFLIATLGGIITMYIKIKKRRSIFYLLGTNAWVFYSCFFILSAVNWSYIIANYNVEKTKNNIDYDYLFTLSSNILPLIDKSIDDVSLDINRSYKLEARVFYFNEEWESKSWLSWNYLDYKTYDYFSK